MFTFTVLVQSEFTVHDPVIVSPAKPPPTFLASVPEMFPAASALTLPDAAPGTGPVGRMRVPLRVNPQSPAALVFEHVSAACTAGTTTTKTVAREIIESFARTILRFIDILLRIDFEAEEPNSRLVLVSTPFHFGNYL